MIDTTYELVLEAKNGNKKALETLLKQQEKNIKATLFYLKKDDLDLADLTQEVLFKINNKITQLKNPKLFKTWLNQVILNSYYDYLRKNKKFKNDTQIDKIDVPDFNSNPQDRILNNELDFIIKTSISTLPIHYKIPITLREIQGLSYDEISSITNTTIQNIQEVKLNNIIENISEYYDFEMNIKDRIKFEINLLTSETLSNYLKIKFDDYYLISKSVSRVKNKLNQH